MLGRLGEDSTLVDISRYVLAMSSHARATEDGYHVVGIELIGGGGAKYDARVLMGRVKLL